MNEDDNESFDGLAIPPSFPRPSSSAHRPKLLNRLSFGSHKKNTKSTAPSSSSRGIGVKVAPSLWPDVVEDHSIYDGLHHASVDTDEKEATRPSKHMGYNCKHIASKASYIPSSSSRTIVDFLGDSTAANSNTLPGSNISVLSHSRRRGSTPAAHNADEDSSISILDATSNARMEDTLDRFGFENFVEHLVDGTVEFVYLKEEFNNPYRFVLCTEIPQTTSGDVMSTFSRSPQYITLSKTGIVRHMEGEAESLSFRQFKLEQNLYYKLLGIPLFTKFRRWKSFTLWIFFTRY